jgi:hypothetical protein
LLLYDDIEDVDHTAGHFPVISTDSRPPNAQAQTYVTPTHDHERNKPIDVRDDVGALRKPFQARDRPTFLTGLTLLFLCCKDKIITE